MRDFSFALRSFARTPVPILLAISAIALGVGANIAVFSIFWALLIKPLPYTSPDRLVSIYETHRSGGLARVDTSLANYEEWRERAQSFESVAASAYWVPALSGLGDTEQIAGGHVTANFFSTLGVRPAIGRDFTPSEDYEGRNTVVVISHAFWTNRLAADPSVLGRKLILDKVPYTIIGVMPPSFEFPDQRKQQIQLWRPLGEHGGKYWGPGYLRVVARLRLNISLQRARSEMTEITRHIARVHPHNAPLEGQAVSLASALRGEAREPLRMLLVAVGLVLLIVCSNVAHLLLARGTDRRREFAIRAALGSTRSCLVRQVLTESVLLGLAGGVLGVILALWTKDAVTVLARSYVPAVAAISLDWVVLGYAAAISIATGVLFGLFPAITVSRVAVNDAIKDGSGSTRSLLFRSFLMGTEIAVTLSLLTTAGLLIRSFWKIQSQELGFQPQRVITGEVRLKRGQEATVYNLSFMTELLSRVSRLPGIEAAALVEALPLSGRNNDSVFFIQDRPEPPANAPNLTMLNFCTPEYFRVLQMRLLHGRMLDERDSSGKPEAVVINDALAKLYFPGVDPIGKQVKLTSEWQTIVGVIADVRHKSLTEAQTAHVYLPYAQHPLPRMTLVVRTRAASVDQISAIRHELAAVDPGIPLGNVRTIEQLLDDAVAPRRLFMALVASFAGLAILLAVSGIYSIISYSVAQRTKEIGVRIALGATFADVLALMVRQASWVLVTGLVLGVAMSLGTARALKAMLFGIQPNDSSTFLISAGLMTLVALGAIFVPARRAATINPVMAIRHE